MFTFPVGFFNLIASGGGDGTTDPFFANRLLLLNANGSNNSTAIVDSSSYNRSLNVIGAGVVISTTQSKWGGSSLYFPGNSSTYLTTANNTTINFSSSNNFSIEGWVYRIGNNIFQAFICNHPFYPGAGYVFGVYLDNTLWFQVAGGTVDIRTSGIVPANTWTYVGVSKSGNNYTLAINDVKETFSTGATWNASDQAEIRIGRSPRNDYPFIFNGYLDDLRVSDMASSLILPTSQFYASTPTDPYAANVVLFLKGDGTNGGTNIIDSSPSPKTISVFGTAQISTAQSKYGGSSLFATNTTVGNFVQAATTINLSANYTFEAWIYQTAAQDCTLLAGADIGGVDFAITGSQIRIGRTNVAWDVIANVTFTYNTFQHIAFSRSSGIQKIFLNGVEVFSGNYETGLTATNPRVMCTRDNSAAQFVRQLNGYIDSVRFTDSVARYTANFNPETDTYLNV